MSANFAHHESKTGRLADSAPSETRRPRRQPELSLQLKRQVFRATSLWMCTFLTLTGSSKISQKVGVAQLPAPRCTRSKRRVAPGPGLLKLL